MNNLRPLNYSSIRLGNTRLQVDKNNNVDLWVDGEHFMGLTTNTFWQAKEFELENSLAYGTCVTTGLGLGLVQLQMMKNPKVDHVIVYEKSQDVIDIFRSFIAQTDIDISKLTILQQDADSVENITVDCIFLDHFSDPHPENIIPKVQRFCKSNHAHKVWYWPAAYHFLMYIGQKNLNINLDSYARWRQDLNLLFMSELDLSHIDDIKSLSNLYKTDTKQYIYGETLNNLDKKREIMHIIQKNRDTKSST